MSFSYNKAKNILFLFIGLLLVIASIIPKGSWSYFNDSENIEKGIFVASVDLEVTSNPNYTLTNMFPDENEESVPYNIHIKNMGTTDVNELYLNIDYDSSRSDFDVEPFASQFKVEFLADNLQPPQDTWNLYDLVSQPPNMAEWLQDGQLNVDEELNLTLQFTFIKTEESQAHFEGKSFPITFEVEGIVGVSNNDQNQADNP